MRLPLLCEWERERRERLRRLLLFELRLLRPLELRRELLRPLEAERERRELLRPLLLEAERERDLRDLERRVVFFGVLLELLLRLRLLAERERRPLELLRDLEAERLFEAERERLLLLRFILRTEAK